VKKVKSERSPEQKKALLEESAKMLAETDAANKAALESEGITHPKAQTAAAMADLGASAQDAFDFFSAAPEKKPLTKPKPKRICRRRAHLFQGVQKPERVSRAMAQHAAG